MKLCGSVLCVLLLAIVRPLVGAPTDYASVRAEVVKAYAQQAEEMARAGGSARNKCKHVCRCAADTECLRGLMAPNPCLSDCCPPLVRRPVPSTKAKRIGKVGTQALNFLGCSRF